MRPFLDECSVDNRSVFVSSFPRTNILQTHLSESIKEKNVLMLEFLWEMDKDVAPSARL